VVRNPKVWLVCALFAAVAGVTAISARPHTHAQFCSTGFCLFAGGVQPQEKPAADLVLLNGVIYTVNQAQPRAQALAVQGERIVAVGTTSEIRSWVGEKTRVIDLHGRLALPGFNDAHIHLANGGQAQLTVDLSATKTLDELQQRIRARLADYPTGEWITGRGWDHTLWPGKRFPSRQDLDAVSTDHPMIFTRVDGHVAVVNSLALQHAGVTRETADPPGGEIERDAAGNPTGLLKENAMAMVRRQIPPLSPERRRRGIELALAEAARHGVTSVQDNSDWEDFLVYDQLRKEGKLTLRVTEWLPFTAPLERLEQMRRRGGTTDPWVKTGALKGVVDGTLGSRTAALLEPFSDNPSTTGILRIPADDVAKMAIERDKAGFQIALHAIGDRANRVALDAIEAARKTNGARDARHKVEHAQVVAPADFARFADLGVIASMQPCHETTDMRWAQDRVGPERAKGAYAWKSMLQHKVPLAFGTDYPVEPLNPMIGLYACVTRERPEGGPAGGWIPQEKISIEECIHGYTAGSAYAEFAEKDKGRLQPGLLADIVVLSDDVTHIPAPRILQTRAVLTIVGGRVVYEMQ
jgi:hypothetical protein